MIRFDYDKKYRKGKLVCDEEMLNFVRNHFSVKNEDAEFVKRKLKAQGKSVSWVSDRSYAIQKTGMFDFGLWKEIESFLISEQITELEYSEEFQNMFELRWKDVEVFDCLSKKLRDYQVDALKECLEEGNGTVVVGTGGGKSLIQASLLENWKRHNGSVKAIVVVPGLTLVSQLENDFAEYGVSFTFSGWTGGSSMRDDTDVIIVNSENFCSQFGNFPKLRDVGVVLVDECHKTKDGNVLTKLVQKIRTPHKYGFTGTLPKTKMDEWKIFGTFGPVIYEKKSKSLRDDDYLSNVEVRFLKLVHGIYKKWNYKKERSYLEECEKRMDLVVRLSDKLKKNVLVLVDRIEYGQRLTEELKKTDAEKEVRFVFGEVPVEVRREIIDLMERENNVVCVAMSSIFSTGINIRNLHYIIFTFGGKSFIRAIQSIGRGLRLHENKTKLLLFDLYDDMRYSKEHAEERKTFYDEEQIPWTETIVNL